MKSHRPLAQESAVEAGTRHGRGGGRPRTLRMVPPVSFQGTSSNMTPPHSACILSSCRSSACSRLAASLVSCACGQQGRGEGWVKGEGEGLGQLSKRMLPAGKIIGLLRTSHEDEASHTLRHEGHHAAQGARFWSVGRAWRQPLDSHEASRTLRTTTPRRVPAFGV